MSQPHPELLILAVALFALAMAPLASKLVRNVGDKISGELDGGRTGDALNAHLDEAYDGVLRDDEIQQMIEARAFVRGEAAPGVEDEVRRVTERGGTATPSAAADDLRDEVRQLVVASNERRERMGEPLLDVETEVARRLARLLGTNGHSTSG